MSEATPVTPAGLERAADARWARLAAVLDVRPDAPLHGAGSRWEARDEYAHLARWMGVAAGRIRAAAAGRRAPAPSPDPNLAWQAEDRALTLAAARERCAAARDDLLAAARVLPADEDGDGLRAMAAGDLVAHLDEHFGFLVGALRGEEAAGWAALTARLDAAPAGATLYAGDGVAWDARDVYAHLARWFAFGAESFDAAANGAALPPPGDFDARNAGWRAADHGRPLADARRAAAAGRERLLAAAEGTPVERWTAPLFNRFDGCAPGHYREHLAYLDAG